ncbi:MAG TPA: hypothetical protein VHE35_34410, partial [Kofleriaceae bacterium]|nr:hypothetical protein [Kofleriaceae bacterium]
AGGDVTVKASGGVRASGGPGGVGSGGGGGGSGGAIVVRTGGRVTLMNAPSGWLSAAGGAGGMGHGGGQTAASRHDGGAGGLGRIRVDAAAGDVGNLSTTPAPVRGPSWDAATPVVLDQARSAVALTLLGDPGRAFPLRLNDSELPSPVTPGPNGAATVRDLALVPGHNQLCAVAVAGVLQPESLACIDLFYSGR